MRVYFIKKLIDGKKMGFMGKLVAVPDIDYDRNIFFADNQPFVVQYRDKKMLIRNYKEGLTFRTFPDRLGRGTYRLGYFRWTKGGE